jgi:RNA polymerase sigma factor (sigma-70 family)
MAEMPLTRASLLVRLRDPQNEAAWAQFLDIYGPLVYGFVRKQGLQDADASDLAQEIMQAVCGAVGRFEYDHRRGAFRNWLFTIVRRKLSSWRVKQSRQVRGSGDSATHQLLQQSPSLDAGAESEWEVANQQRLFTWACGQVEPCVTPKTWQAFWRTAVDGKSGKEVAADLGMSVAAVYLARSRVLARLQELIQSVQVDEAVEESHGA